MWIVRLAIDRPYTFVVVSILIAIIGVLTATRMPVDIFPAINIPVVSVIWSYTGLCPEDMEARILTVSERAMTTAASNIEHMESNALNGVGIIKVFLQNGADIGAAVSLMSAINQTILRVLPPGITPPALVSFSASDVPVLTLGVSSKTLTEAQIYDYDLNFIRTRLATVRGAAIPLPYGGKQRQIMVDLSPAQLLGKGLSATDVVTALSTQNLILPAGSAKMGPKEFPIKLNSSPDAVELFNSLPIKQFNNSTVYMRDVGLVHDGYAVQTNVVRVNGKRATLLNVLKSGGASTLQVAEGMKETLPLLRATLPKSLNILVQNDQSIFVKGAITQVLHEAVTAAALTALLMVAFLGSWRSTLIVASSIPLAILTSVIGLGICGQTLNTMTLGGLSLAVGMLVDDATVEVENIHRILDQKVNLKEAVLTSAAQVALPAFVSTLSICIVFVPVVLLTEPSRSLFVPLAMAVVFAMMASYFLSRTLVPLMSVYLLKSEEQTAEKETHTSKISAWIDARFNQFRDLYCTALETCLGRPRLTTALFGIFLVISLCLIPFIGQDFFPSVDSGQLRLHLIAPVGSRIEETEQWFSKVEAELKHVVAPDEWAGITENMGAPSNGLALAYGDNTNYTNADGEMLITLNHEHHRSTFEYQKRIRQMMDDKFPNIMYYFQPADITTQILNAGLQAPIDIQVSGRGHKEENYRIALELKKAIALVPGAVDVVVRQPLHQPQINLDVNRSKAMELGLTQRDVASSVLTSLSSSFQGTPNFWVNPQNGVNYSVAVQTPSYKVRSIDDLQATLITGSSGAIVSSSAAGTGAQGQTRAQVTNGLGEYTATSTQAGVSSLLLNLANTRRSTTSAIVSHYAIQPVFDVFVNVQDRDLAGVSGDIQEIVSRYKTKLPAGSLINIRGQASSMHEAFTGLLGGMLFALVLVYLLLVVNFQSWIDPLIILMAIPGALSGVVWMLFLCQTTFCVPALMGAIMSIGVGAANSILMVSFANDRRKEGDKTFQAVSLAGFLRFRPVLMTAAAMIVGMLPMSTGLGEGGAQNAPLGRAVIGGLMIATFYTLLFVPVVYSMLKRDANS